ncbi:2Fe-2S iron-sulfur cluster-binding protein [Halomicrobium salinisoli]|uniref:2Fe-2S iron-sulfur cluster-binding protein n=1 Tax=Halomicrobium salinisoli TaxID=2878391 RepID=UPI001CF03D59|nr:2Fe-2S iron-sulfur cluster-binding protein [Halomicrobium salinisoli]
MVDPASVAAGAALTLVLVAIHYSTGTGWEANEDISQEVLEQRAATVPDTEFPEPYNRSIGGGGAAAIPAGEAEGELAEGEEGEEDADEGFDPDAIPEDEVEYYEVEFAKEGETIEIANNENILDAGEEEGWDLPYACRQGQCVSCAGQIQEGAATDYIRHSQNESLFEDDMEDGYCLTCVAYPTDDFTLETGEQP